MEGSWYGPSFCPLLPDISIITTSSGSFSFSGRTGRICSIGTLGVLVLDPFLAEVEDAWACCVRRSSAPLSFGRGLELFHLKRSIIFPANAWKRPNVSLTKPSRGCSSMRRKENNNTSPRTTRVPKQEKTRHPPQG